MTIIEVYQDCKAELLLLLSYCVNSEFCDLTPVPQVIKNPVALYFLEQI